MLRAKNLVLVFFIALTLLLGSFTNTKPAAACGGDGGTCNCPTC